MENINAYAFELVYTNHQIDFLIIAKDNKEALAWVENYAKKEQEASKYIDNDGNEKVAWWWKEYSITETEVKEDCYNIKVLM